MTQNKLAFHAAPPAGHWINDPNGLIYFDGAYRLFVQHRDDAPQFRATGWGRFSSPNLLDWTFDGSVMPPEDDCWNYSGSIVRTGNRLIAFHTLHERGSEWQVRRWSDDGGLHWSDPETLPSLGRPARNRRDPYIFRDGEGWALLLAEPCDWTDWAMQPASRLRLYRSNDGIDWREAGTIGPWRAPGIMWEVPILARIDGHDILFVSEVDRRDGGAACSVRAWIGSLTETSFTPDRDVPADGQLVDLGPDFYALMAGIEDIRAQTERPFIGWLSSWQTARAIDWPGFAGGPISLPRQLAIEHRQSGPVLLVRPNASVESHFTESVAKPPAAGMGQSVLAGNTLSLSITSDKSSAIIEADFNFGQIRVRRRGQPPADWDRAHRIAKTARSSRTLQLFVDGPIIELFLIEDGIAISLVLETGSSPFTVEARSNDTPVPIEWRQRPFDRGDND